MTIAVDLGRKATKTNKQKYYNAFNVYCRELAPGTVSLTGDRAQGDDRKHWAYSTMLAFLEYEFAAGYPLHVIKSDLTTRCIHVAFLQRH